MPSKEWLRGQGYWSDQFSWLDRWRMHCLDDDILRAIKVLVDRNCPGLAGLCEGRAGEGMSFVRYVGRYGLAALVIRLEGKCL